MPHLSGVNNLSVNNNSVERNSAHFGGGIYIEDSVVFLSQNSILHNIGSEAGGGLGAVNSILSCDGNTIAGNLTQQVQFGQNCTAVTANPNLGSTFSGWTGSYSGNVNPLTISNVTSDMTITANFTVQTCFVTFQAGPNGQVIGNLNQTVSPGGSTTSTRIVHPVMSIGIAPSVGAYVRKSSRISPDANSSC